LTARSSGTVSSAPEADVPRVRDLVEDQDRSRSLQGRRQHRLGQEIGQQGGALMHRVAAEQLVDACAIHCLGCQRPRGRQARGECGGAFFGEHQPAQAAHGVREGRLYGVQPVEPDGAARRLGGVRRAGLAIPRQAFAGAVLHLGRRPVEAAVGLQRACLVPPRLCRPRAEAGRFGRVAG
jgi:hypothetical protein